MLVLESLRVFSRSDLLAERKQLLRSVRKWRVPHIVQEGGQTDQALLSLKPGFGKIETPISASL